MTKSHRPIPATLVRAGITQVVDNIPPGMCVGGFESAFVRLFKTEIIKKCFVPGDNRVENMPSISKKPTSESSGQGTDRRGSARSVRSLPAGPKPPAIRKGRSDQGDLPGTKTHG